MNVSFCKRNNIFKFEKRVLTFLCKLWLHNLNLLKIDKLFVKYLNEIEVQKSNNDI